MGVNRIFSALRIRKKCGIKIETHDEQYWPLCSREFLQSFQPNFEKIARPNFGFFQIFIVGQIKPQHPLLLHLLISISQCSNTY
jgi:hypothetical protein